MAGLECLAMLFKLYSVDLGGKSVFFEVLKPYALLLGECMFGLLSHDVVKGLYIEIRELIDLNFCYNYFYFIFLGYQ